MGNRLNNKVAIVTGGGAGIGEAICKKFAAEGARVVVCGFAEDPVQDVAREITASGGTAIFYKGDISLAQNAQDCVQLAVNTFGKLDVLINNAGVFPAVGFIEDFEDEALTYLLKNNIQSAYMMTKYAVPYLQKAKGSIVNAGSEAGLNGDPQNAPYAGTKGFIHAFTRSVAVEQAQKGVRANCVCPGAIDTSWLHHQTSPMTAKMEKSFIAATPMGRRGTPEEIANVYLFLASDESSYVTGALFSADGGITISKGFTGPMADKALKTPPEGELDLRHTMQGDPVVREFVGEENENGPSYRIRSQEEVARHESNGKKSGLRNSLVGISLGLSVAGALVGLARRYGSGSHVDTDAYTPETDIDTTEPASAVDQTNIDAYIPTTTTETETDVNEEFQKASKRTPKSKPNADTDVNSGHPASGQTETGRQPGSEGFTSESATGNVD